MEKQKDRFDMVAIHLDCIHIGIKNVGTDPSKTRVHYSRFRAWIYRDEMEEACKITSNMSFQFRFYMGN